MAETINWLHLTDLHYGVDNDGWLWPKARNDIFRDIERLSKEIDGWDLVFFTGDLVQNGRREEYIRLEIELERIWEVLGKSGRSPFLCVVPGNHDLFRPDSDSAITKSLTKLWLSDPSLRRQFWTNPNCEYRQAIIEYFANYISWLETTKIPVLPSMSGELPGDFSATYEKGDVKLGIAGLNSTFLQLIGGDRKGFLDLHVSQLNAACNRDPEAWIGAHDLSILLTHQPPSWLTPEAYEHFRQEIYPPGRFFALLCGHQHEPETIEFSEAGAAPRRYRQGPSMFGLEDWEGPVPTKRIHGYNAGQFVFQDGHAYEKFWPRLATRGRSGGDEYSPGLLL